MSTLQKAYDSMRRRRGSIGHDIRMPSTPATPATRSYFSNSYPAKPSSAWDGRINVEEKQPMKIFTQSATPASAAPPRTSTTAGSPEADPSKRKKRTAAGSKKKKKKVSGLAKPPVAYPCTSLSSMQVRGTRATALTTTSAAVHHQNEVTSRSSANRHIDHRNPNGSHCHQISLQKASEELWPENGRDGEDGGNNSEGHLNSCPHPHPACYPDGNDDAIDLEVSSDTQSDDSDFEYEMSATPMSTISPTSYGVSCRTAESLPAAMVVSPSAASRTPAEGASWTRVPSQPTILQGNTPTASTLEGASAQRKTVTTFSARSPGRTPTAPSPPAVGAPIAPPSSQQLEEKVEIVQGGDGVAVHFATAELLNRVSAQSMSEESLKEDVENCQASLHLGRVCDVASHDENRDDEAASEATSIRPPASPVKADAAKAAVPQVAKQSNGARKEGDASETALNEVRKADSPGNAHVTARERHGEEARSAATAVVEAPSAAISASAPADTPSKQAPRRIASTSARSVVCVTAVAATSTAANSARGMSRARARLAGTYSSQQIPAPPPSQQQTKSDTLPSSTLSPAITPAIAAVTVRNGTRGPDPADEPIPRSSSPRSPARPAASSERLSRTSSLAEPSPSESSAARRRVRRVAVTAAALRSISNDAGDTALATTGTPASTLRSNNSETTSAGSYEKRQKLKARYATGAASAATQKAYPTAAATLSSPFPKPQPPAVLSIELIDRCIYQNVMVSPPAANERMEVPPVMERPLSYYEQGMYNRHREHAPAHYKKALLHEQRALLRNTAWLPVTTILDQRSGGIGAMMMDEFRHMVRVIRYAQELENWKGALMQSAKYDAHCAELMHAATLQDSTVLDYSMKPAKAALGNQNMQATPLSKKLAKLLSPHNPTGQSADQSATATACPAATTIDNTRMIGADRSSHARHQHSGVVARSPDYSDSDADSGKATEKRASTAFASASASAKSAPMQGNGAAAVSEGRSALSESASHAPSTALTGKANTTPATATALAKASFKEELRADKDNNKKRSVKPTFLSWLAGAFGVERSKEKSQQEHQQTPSKSEGNSATPKWKSIKRPDVAPPSPSNSPQQKPRGAVKAAPSPILIRPASTVPALGVSLATAVCASREISATPTLLPTSTQTPASNVTAAVSPTLKSTGDRNIHQKNVNVHGPIGYASASNEAVVAATETVPAVFPDDSSSAFSEELHVSRFHVRSARCSPVELPPPPIPVFRLYIFHPLEVLQELKRMVWWAATHHFTVIHVLTGTTATARTPEATETEEEGEEDYLCSASRRRKRRVAAAVAIAAGGKRDASPSSSCSLPSTRESRSPPMSSRANTSANTHHETVYFNTVLLNLRIDRWLVRHVVLTRRDAERGLVGLEITKEAQAEAKDALKEEEDMLGVTTEQQHSPTTHSAACPQFALATTFFFNADTRTPR
ncbi:hypothetical protein ABL78_7295 [Leptomonas seymouri]|uniref:Uncharacterized protein n=1 Tax=Leptomonas seymouri TaxID=5684 RepID=A0A0N0P335_LEPSE|nr:hypothetical protein ABL78_7295 [Leptomonas seymouri]|eukprot:KPI83669.1 hypothetical protein ABL78_7295 [Leptomonas seymouri]